MLLSLHSECSRLLHRDNKGNIYYAMFKKRVLAMFSKPTHNNYVCLVFQVKEQKSELKLDKQYGKIDKYPAVLTT